MSLPRESWDVLGDMGPYETREAALEDIEEFRKDPRSLLLAAIDKQREKEGMECFAGVYGLIEYNADEGVSISFVPIQQTSFRVNRIDGRTSCSA